MTTINDDDNDNDHQNEEVIVIGGGIVGLTTSLLLQSQGIGCMMVEKHSSTCIHPRARGLNGRSMEIMRMLGVDHLITEAGADLSPSKGIYSGVTLKSVLGTRVPWKLVSVGVFLITIFILVSLILSGRQFTIFMILVALALVYYGRLISNYTRYSSPSKFTFCTQDKVEPILLNTINIRNNQDNQDNNNQYSKVKIELNTELIEIKELDDVGEEGGGGGLEIKLKDRLTNQVRVARCKYLVACDGAKSTVRQLLGVEFKGQGELSLQLNIYFRSDLSSALLKNNKSRFSMCLVENQHVRGLFAAINNRDLWVLHVSISMDETVKDYPTDRCIELVRKAVGIDDLEVEIKGALPWYSTVRLASEYRPRGRVLLAGDAAHVMPPWGGFGANSGIADTHNLVWKLIQVLNGVSSPDILDSYHVERRPIADRVSSLAANLNDSRGLIKIGLFSSLPTFFKIFPYLVVGYGYSSNIIINDYDNDVPTPSSTDLYGRPGTRFPHKLINYFESTNNDDDNSSSSSSLPTSSNKSTLDLLKYSEYTLIGSNENSKWIDYFSLASKQLMVPLNIKIYNIDFTFQSTVVWSDSFGVDVSSGGVLLVRPDGFVAWRSTSITSSSLDYCKSILSICYSLDSTQ